MFVRIVYSCIARQKETDQPAGQPMLQRRKTKTRSLLGLFHQACTRPNVRFTCTPIRAHDRARTHTRAPLKKSNEKCSASPPKKKGRAGGRENNYFIMCNYLQETAIVDLSRFFVISDTVRQQGDKRDARRGRPRGKNSKRERARRQLEQRELGCKPSAPGVW